ncbi:hypothetical protein ACFTZI_21650 [Streptomyces decoyicus]|uniref:hypothetical protein n=1 Tax=Streptomyces decoyicus TaxID=249567 RepID=UPI00362E63D5
MHISDTHLDKLRSDGYTLAEDFLTGDDLKKAQKEVLRYFPTSQEWLHTPDRTSATSSTSAAKRP